jgi:hypothetical protein
LTHVRVAATRAALRLKLTEIDVFAATQKAKFEVAGAPGAMDSVTR